MACRNRRRRPRTRQDIRKLRWLDPFLGPLMLDEITLDVIDGIKAEKLKTAGKPTVNRYLALVRAILLRARDEWEWIDKTPKVKLFKEGPGRERSITVEQAETLLGELPAHQRDVVLFALATGLAAVQCASVWSGRTWTSRPAMPGWARINRRIAGRLPCRSTRPRWRCCDGSSVSTASGCLRMLGSRLAWANTLAWRKALKRAGIENFRWHDMRHTWASWHRQSGTPTHELQRLGGWRSSVMVERYAHLAPDHLAKAANRLDSLLGGYDLATSEKGAST